MNYDDKNWDALASAFKTNHKVKHFSFESLCKLWFIRNDSTVSYRNVGLKCLLLYFKLFWVDYRLNKLYKLCKDH